MTKGANTQVFLSVNNMEISTRTLSLICRIFPLDNVLNSSCSAGHLYLVGKIAAIEGKCYATDCQMYKGCRGLSVVLHEFTNPLIYLFSVSQNSTRSPAPSL